MISAPALTMPPDLANGATAPADAPASTAAAHFDFILALEALAASAAEQQAAAAAGAATPEELPDLGDGCETDELDDDADEGSLEFLAGLLNAVAPRPAAAASDAGIAVASASAGAAGSAGAAPDPDVVKDTAGNAGNAGVAGAIAGMLAEQGAAADAAQTVTDSDALPARANELLAPAARPAPATVEQSTITTHVRDPRWAEEFGTRITTLVRGGESRAALQLSPVDLGPVDVTVTVRDSQATIHFGAAQADTRALIEASLPRLREMLAAQGFNLLDASVSQGFTQQGRPEAAGVPRPGIDPLGDAEPVIARHAAGLLDLYA